MAKRTRRPRLLLDVDKQKAEVEKAVEKLRRKLRITYVSIYFDSDHGREQFSKSYL